MTTKPLVFISHITEEQELAAVIKDEIIETNLLGCVDVFVSSDSRVNSGGQSWLKNIEDALQRATVFIILASPQSINRPWINIEAGAGWVRQLQANAASQKNIYVMPICHSGQSLSSLPKPWDTLNAVECNSVSGLQEIINIVGTSASLTKIPKPNFDTVRAKISGLELKYSYFSKIESSVNSILSLFPIFKVAFLGQVPQGQIVMGQKLSQHDINTVHKHRAYLESEGLIVFQMGGVQQIIGGPNSGTWVEAGMNVTPKFMATVSGKIKIN